MSLVPESAIKKAADALIPHVGFAHSEIAARVALDASAQDIAGTAWEEGYCARMMEDSDSVVRTANPYGERLS